MQCLTNRCKFSKLKGLFTSDESGNERKEIKDHAKKSRINQDIFTNLREGNVFTGVCLFTGGSVSMVPVPSWRVCLTGGV